MSTAPTHVRDHRSVLAAAEKRLLVWLARRLPAWLNSDHLSLLGLASMFAAGLAFAVLRPAPWSIAAVIIALAANWFGDSLDGTLARVRNQQRPRYGFYVDHVIDVAGATFLFAGLALSAYMSAAIALALLAAYLLVSAESFLSTHTLGVFRLSFLGFGPTELRILLAIGAFATTRTPWVSIGSMAPMRLFDLGGLVAIAGLALAFTASAVRTTRALYLAEPIPTPRTVNTPAEHGAPGQAPRLGSGQAPASL